MLILDQTTPSDLDTKSSPHHAFITALISGGDSRLALDFAGLRNKYLCHAEPAVDILCASSCTASPITPRGFFRAQTWHQRLAASIGTRNQALLLDALTQEIRQAILAYYDIPSIAHVILCPSGTDALAWAARLMAAQSPATPITSILPAASETGSGVPAAVGESLVFIDLRDVNGQPLPADVVVDSYAKAIKSAHGRTIIYLTPGTKTGLMTPEPPADVTDVIVDACQTRVETTTIKTYLQRGWPVVITGSKFFGGPAFSGAVLLPNDRFAANAQNTSPSTDGHPGMLLRWIAAVETMEAFQPLRSSLPAFLRQWNATLTSGLAEIPTIAPIGGLTLGGTDWQGLASIQTFAVRSRHVSDQFLSVSQIKPIYERLSQAGVLLGQPVELGSYGGLRIALGARDIVEPNADAIPRILSALRQATTPPSQ